MSYVSEAVSPAHSPTRRGPAAAVLLCRDTRSLTCIPRASPACTCWVSELHALPLRFFDPFPVYIISLSFSFGHSE